ncbi:hypothetical protein PQX77_002336 [Marasmius sp. AFHP31]|nr:hypothetical protein PQX77_002336 [Marasmius sp. AFHP31]
MIFSPTTLPTGLRLSLTWLPRPLCESGSDIRTLRSFLALSMLGLTRSLVAWRTLLLQSWNPNAPSSLSTILFMGRWVTCPFYHYNPILHEEFYLDKLNRAESPSVWDYQREDSKLDNYFSWDEVAINNMWE